MNKAKSDSDHRNPHFAAMLPAGATIGIRISRESPPQARCGCPLRGHVAQVRQKVLSDFSKKILLGFSFRANPRRGFALFAPLAQIHPLLRFADASRGSARGSAPTPRKPFEKGLSLNFILERASKFYVDITTIGQISADIT